MFKMLAPVVKKRGLSTPEFTDLWREHGDVLREFPDSAPPIRRYYQCHLERSVYADSEPAYDGVTELWFDDFEAFQGWAGHSYYEDVAHPHGSSFADMEGTDYIFCQEIPCDAGSTEPEPVKLFRFLTRRRGWSIQEFTRHWQTRFAPRLTSTPSYQHHAVRYAQNHPFANLHPGGTPFDGISSVWFDTVEALQTWRRSGDAAKVLAPAEEEFSNREERRTLVTREIQVI